MSMDDARLSARLERLELHLGLRPKYPKPGPPFYGHTATSGLHFLKDAWCQVAHMLRQIDWLRDELELALNATRLLAPNRGGIGFQLEKRITHDQPKNGPERLLEWKLYQKYGLSQTGQDANHEILQRLIGLQVPVYDNQGRDGWDKIDLVGIDPNGVPVVFELKNESAKDKPLRLLLEGTAYAVALKNVWDVFHTELLDVLSRHPCPSLRVIPNPRIIRVCPIAPTYFWTRLFANKAITSKCHQLLELSAMLGTFGFPVTFGEIKNDLSIEVFDIKAQLGH